MAGCVLNCISLPLSGQSLHTRYMTVTQDGCLFMSTRDNKVAKVRIEDSQIIINKTGLSALREQHCTEVMK